jgi:hypothetical protein
MRREGWYVSGLVTLVLVLYPVLALSHAGSPDPRRTGAPVPEGGFELTCGDGSECHSDAAVNSGLGSISIEAPENYGPNNPLEITVRVEEAGKVFFGFEVAVKNASHEHAGTLELIDMDVTRYAHPSNQEYVSHDGPDGLLQNAWTVRWVPPGEDVGPVTIYAAGNAANGNGGSNGDNVYTTSKTLTFDIAAEVEAEAMPDVFHLARAYPNPFTSQTTIRYDLKQAAPVTLALYDALGRRVRLLDLGTQPVGSHEVRLDAEMLPAGLYLYELRTPQAREARPLLLMR